MTKKQQRHIIASVGTALFLLLVFLILWFCYLTAVAPEQDEGIEVEFAELEEVDEPEEPSMSAYAPEPSEAAPAAPASPAPEVATSPKPASPPEHIVSEEETLALERARKEKEEREAAEKARKKKEAEQTQKANNLINNLGFGKNSGTNTEGDGSGNDAGQAGNPLGGRTSGSGRDGRIMGLKGRSPRDGKLPEPTCEFDHYGVVVVQIKIDKDGNNIYAVNASGTNTSDKEMIQCAINAIKKTKWTAGDGEAVGTITYTFNVK